MGEKLESESYYWRMQYLYIFLMSPAPFKCLQNYWFLGIRAEIGEAAKKQNKSFYKHLNRHNYFLNRFDVCGSLAEALLQNKRACFCLAGMWPPY